MKTLPDGTKSETVKRTEGGFEKTTTTVTTPDGRVTTYKRKRNLEKKKAKYFSHRSNSKTPHNFDKALYSGFSMKKPSADLSGFEELLNDR